MTELFPSLITERLLLKPLTYGDADGYAKYFIDYEVIRHLSSVIPWPYPQGGVADFFKIIMPEQGVDRWTWGIYLKSNPSELIGCIDLWQDGCPENRGFWLGKPFWGKGIMTEAAMVTTEFAFNNLGFERIAFSNALGNIRSRRIKEKTGARFTGMRAAKFVDPDLTEAENWELSKEDWLKSRIDK